MGRLNAVGFLDFMDYLFSRIIKIDFYPIETDFFISHGTLWIGIFMYESTFRHQFRYMLHINSVCKQPQFPFAHEIIVEMGPGYPHNQNKVDEVPPVAGFEKTSWCSKSNPEIISINLSSARFKASADSSTVGI